MPSAQLAALAAGSLRGLHCSVICPMPALHIPPVTTSTASLAYPSSTSHPSPPTVSHSPFPSSRLSSIFTASHASHLRRYGFTIIDNALGDSYCAQLRDETLALKRHDLMEPNHTHLRTPSHTTLLPKRNISEIDTHIPGLAALAPAFHTLTTDLSLLHSLAGLLPQLALHSQSVKVQHNAGDNACFPLHFDSDYRVDNRHLTAILYLNPEWQSGWGGQLELLPLPWERVRIEPRWDRLVVFATSGVLHRVRPTKHERLCVTLWMTGEERQQPGNKEAVMSSADAVQMDGSDAAVLSTLRTLLSPRFYPHLVKLLNSHEWADSIAQSHHSSADTQAAIAQHWTDVELIQRAIGAAVDTLPPGLLPVPVEEAGDAVRQLGGVEWGRPHVNGGEAADEVRAMQKRIRWDELHSFV